jgi:hypothetical protein
VNDDELAEYPWPSRQIGVYLYEPQKASVTTHPMAPLPEGTKVYRSDGTLFATLGPPLPADDGEWRNHLIPWPTATPDASAPVDDPDQQTEA